MCNHAAEAEVDQLEVGAADPERIEMSSPIYLYLHLV